MKIVNNLGAKDSSIKKRYIESLGYLGNMRLLSFEKHIDSRSEIWKAKILSSKKIIEYKDLKFYRENDFPNLSTKIKVVILDTENGDVELTDFKSLKTYSILETIPSELLAFLNENCN